MSYAIAYLIGGLIAAFVYTAASRIVEDDAEHDATMRVMLVLAALWPFTMTLFIALLLGQWLRRKG